MTKVILNKKEDLIYKWHFREENKIFTKYECPIFGGLCRLGNKCKSEDIPENSAGCAWCDNGETYNNAYDQDYEKLEFVFANLLYDIHDFTIHEVNNLTRHSYKKIYEVIKDYSIE